MPTECSAEQFAFGTVEGRAVEAAFDAGLVTSDAGALLLGATDRAIGMMDRFAACFHDERRPEWIEHEVATLVGQRVFGIALGYEDLNDHAQLRRDPLLAVACEKRDPLGQDRVFPDNRGVALAAPATAWRAPAVSRTHRTIVPASSSLCHRPSPGGQITRGTRLRQATAAPQPAGHGSTLPDARRAAPRPVTLQRADARRPWSWASARIAESTSLRAASLSLRRSLRTRGRVSRR